MTRAQQAAIQASTASRAQPRLPPDGAAPFFVVASLWAATAMLVWLLMLDNVLPAPGPLGPRDWHVHELLYGFAPAVVVGYLLGIVPNWSGRLPNRGGPRNALLMLWLAGRIALAVAPAQALWWAAGIDLAFLLLAWLLVLREVLVGRDRRAARLLLPLGLLLAGNALFHWQASTGLGPAGLATRAGLAALVLLISLVGGALVPSFTRRWLAQTGRAPIAPELAGLGHAVQITSALALLGWAAYPQAQVVGWLLWLAGLLQAARWLRWQGWRCLPEPLVAALHLGYGFVVAGFMLLGAAIVLPGGPAQADAVHAWSTGAIGVMTLAVMSRVALRRARLEALADAPTAVMLWCAGFAALARLYAGLWPELALALAASAWIAAYLCFVVLFGPMLCSAVPARSTGGQPAADSAPGPARLSD